MDPNLAPFKARGGKLIMSHGWLDASVFAKNSVDYYKSVVQAMGGAAQTTDFFRLFMAPGVEHCGGGPGPGIIDDLTALEQWVEQRDRSDSDRRGALRHRNDRRSPAAVVPISAGCRVSTDPETSTRGKTSLARRRTFLIPQSVAAFSGTPQTVRRRRTFAALQARVTDALSNPTAGVPVTFTAPSSGASATFNGTNSITVNTNASGHRDIARAARKQHDRQLQRDGIGSRSHGARHIQLNERAAKLGLTIFGTTTPATVFANSTSVELGVKFRSEVGGNITGVRFYKASGTTRLTPERCGPQPGQSLATGVFTGETTSGWQTLSSQRPLQSTQIQRTSRRITRRALTIRQQTVSRMGVDRSPLHALKDGVDGFNGVFLNGAGGNFPNQGFVASNFWADVVFLPTTVAGSGFSDVTPPAISAVSITSITPSSAFVNWATNEAADGQVEFISPCPTGGCLLPLVPALTTSHRIGVTGLSASTLYTYRILSKDNVGNVGVTPNQTFTTAPSNFTTSSMWTNGTTPATQSDADTRAIEVGVKFKSDVAGLISAIRFFKGSLNTGTHTVSLWTAAGALLARSVSSGETASGWQQVDFPAVNITANTTYIASYHTTSGHYSFNGNYFGSQFNNGPLHGLADGTSGGNGLWQTSAHAGIPDAKLSGRQLLGRRGLRYAANGGFVCAHHFGDFGDEYHVHKRRHQLDDGRTRGRTG